MHTQKTEPTLSSLKGIFWLSLFELIYSSSGILSEEITNISAREGDEARLPCNYKISEGRSLESYYIYWQKRTSGKPDLVVISYKLGNESESEKNVHYKNRTKMDKHNLTLSISPVKLSDRGIYKCIAILQSNKEGEGVANLSVTAPFSKPIIQHNLSSVPCDTTELTLSCSSHGGSSWPKMYGFVNKKAVNWTSTVTSYNQFRRYNITGTLQLNMTENMLVQCSVGFSDFQVSTNYSLNMTVKCSKPTLPPPTSPFGIIISSAVILIFLLAVVLLVTLQYYFRNRPKPSTTHQPLATDEVILQELSNGQTPSGLGRSPL